MAQPPFPPSPKGVSANYEAVTQFTRPLVTVGLKLDIGND